MPNRIVEGMNDFYIRCALSERTDKEVILSVLINKVHNIRAQIDYLLCKFPRALQGILNRANSGFR